MEGSSPFSKMFFLNANSHLLLHLEQAAHPTPTARWSDLSAALLPPKEVDLDLVEVNLVDPKEVNLVDPILTTVAPMIPTDAAAPVTRIVLNWRQRCRTISQPSVREGSVSRDAGGLMIMMQIVLS